ncbi:MAG TPA: SDR family oxidoreductase [Baekduia sp.]|nr:SDR family oxidoreductase [Baekduia sp.]
MARLDGKVAFVTGAAQGIGLAVAQRFTADGATVVVSDIDDARTQEAVQAVGGGASGIACDVSDEAQVQALVDGVVQQHGRIDVAVANAGIAIVEPTVGSTLENWRKVTSVNLDGVFLTLTKAGAQMASQGGGSLITIASITALAGTPLIGSYAAAKAGAVNVTKTVNTELRQHGVRANAICPGFVDTELVRTNKHVFEEALGIEDFDALIEQKEGRYGRPEEVAALASFLASDRSAFCSGGHYVLDGGARASAL